MTPMSTQNVELTRDAYLAMNRGDIDWLVQHSDPELEMHFLGVAGEPVLYVGASGIRDYFRDIAEIWDSVEYTPRTSGISATARSRSSGVASAGRTAD